MHVIQGCCWRHHNIFRSLLTQPEWTVEMCYKLPSTMKTEAPHEGWSGPSPRWQSPGNGLVWPTLLLGWGHRPRKSFCDADSHEKTPRDALSDQVSKNESKESVSSFSIPSSILESAFSHLFQMPRPHKRLLWHCTALTSHQRQLLSGTQRLGKQIKTTPNISGGYICRPGLSFHHEPICL